jgi:hypothetical protein
MTLRNLPPQPPFVVEWDFPLMVERPDLDPADLKLVEGEQVDDDLEPLLELLDEKPLTSSEWQEAAEELGYSRATFFRMKQKLESENRVRFDRKDKTWARVSDASGHPDTEAHLKDEQTEGAETREPDETFDNSETGAPPVSSLTSIKERHDLVSSVDCDNSSEQPVPPSLNESND